MNIKVADLVAGDNVRLEADTNLVQSVAENGVKVPLCLYMRDGAWIIKDGHRRLAAALALGLEEVPGVEVEAPEDSAEAVVEQIVINQDRKGLDYLEIAQAYASLKRYGWTQAKIAERFHVSAADVSLALAALRAHPKVQAAINDGRLAPSAVEPLLPLPMEDQVRLIDAAISAKTVRKVRDLIIADRKQKTERPRAAAMREAPVSEAVDPMEFLLVKTVEEAKETLAAVEGTPVSNPELARRGRASVRELIQTAKRLEEAMYVRSAE